MGINKAVAVALLVAACATGPFEAMPDGSLAFAFADTVIYVRRIEPPADYVRWYHGAERCSQRQGDFDGVTWYVASGPIPGTHGESYALWHNRRIILGPDWVKDSGVVRHEALHDVLWVSGWRPVEPEPAGGYTHEDLHPAAFKACADNNW